MRRFIAIVFLFTCVHSLVLGQTKQERPIINGISHFSVYATDPQAAKRFYTGELGFTEGPAIHPGHADYYAGTRQYVSVSQLPAGHSTSRLDAVYFATTDAERLRQYISAEGIKVPSHVDRDAEGSLSFEVVDPDGNHIGFEQQSKKHTIVLADNPTSKRIIHVGFAVHNRAAEDHFYREVLGFRPYWHGGMKDDNVDEWVSLQVPDGSDWLEYMLHGADTSQRSLGILNHFSLGVVDINDAAKKLEEHGWHETPAEHRQDGRDGKRQLNVFDPDMTRVEFMEFSNFREPCCSIFTASNPKP